MASFKSNKLDSSVVNGGKRYLAGDGLIYEDVNRVVEAILWLQSHHAEEFEVGSKITAWDADTNYKAGAVVYAGDNHGVRTLYKAIKDLNAGEHTPVDTSCFEVLVDVTQVYGALLNLQAYVDEFFVHKTTDTSVLYATSDTGQEVKVPYSYGAVGGAIPRRDARGHISVPYEPEQDYDATSKKYVEVKFDEVVTGFQEGRWIPGVAYQALEDADGNSITDTYTNKNKEEWITGLWEFYNDDGVAIVFHNGIRDGIYGAEWNSKTCHLDYQGTRAHFNYDGSFDIESEEENGSGLPGYAKTKFQLPQDEANGVKKTLATREWVNANAGGGGLKWYIHELNASDDNGMPVRLYFVSNIASVGYRPTGIMDYLGNLVYTVSFFLKGWFVDANGTPRGFTDCSMGAYEMGDYIVLHYDDSERNATEPVAAILRAITPEALDYMYKNDFTYYVREVQNV